MEQLPANLIMEWMEYERLEPFGPWRDNYHAAVIASILANAHRNPKKQPTPFQLADFFYQDQETTRKKANETMFTQLRALSKRNG